MTAPGTEKRMSLFEQLRPRLPMELPAFLASKRWYGGKARRIHSIELTDLIPLQTGELEAFVALARVEYDIGTGETYVLPMFVADPEAAHDGVNGLIRVQTADRNQQLFLADALQNEKFLRWLLDAIEVQLVSHGSKGDIRASYTKIFQEIRASKGSLVPRAGSAEQSNSSIIYGDSLILKFFRRI